MKKMMCSIPKNSFWCFIQNLKIGGAQRQVLILSGCQYWIPVMLQFPITPLLSPIQPGNTSITAQYYVAPIQPGNSSNSISPIRSHCPARSHSVPATLRWAAHSRRNTKKIHTKDKYNYKDKYVASHLKARSSLCGPVPTGGHSIFMQLHTTKNTALLWMVGMNQLYTSVDGESFDMISRSKRGIDAQI